MFHGHVTSLVYNLKFKVTYFITFFFLKIYLSFNSKILHKFIFELVCLTTCVNQVNGMIWPGFGILCLLFLDAWFRHKLNCIKKLE